VLHDENTGCKKSPSGHHCITLSVYIFITKARIDNQKKNLLSSSISSTCPHNMVNFGPLVAGIGWRVWCTPPNFNGFRVLAALLHGTPVLGVSQTLWRGTEGATYIQQEGHSALAHISSSFLWSPYGRSPYGIGHTIIFLPCGYFFFFFPRLISAVADWMFAILPHMVWPYCAFKMQV